MLLITACVSSHHRLLEVKAQSLISLRRLVSLVSNSSLALEVRFAALTFLQHVYVETASKSAGDNPAEGTLSALAAGGPPGSGGGNAGPGKISFLPPLTTAVLRNSGGRRSGPGFGSARFKAGLGGMHAVEAADSEVLAQIVPWLLADIKDLIQPQSATAASAIIVDAPHPSSDVAAAPVADASAETKQARFPGPLLRASSLRHTGWKDTGTGAAGLGDGGGARNRAHSGASGAAPLRRMKSVRMARGDIKQPRALADKLEPLAPVLRPARTLEQINRTRAQRLSFVFDSTVPLLVGLLSRLLFDGRSEQLATLLLAAQAPRARNKTSIPLPKLPSRHLKLLMRR